VTSFTLTTLLDLFPAATDRIYNSGQIVVYHGDKPDHVMFIISGAVKFYDIDSDGNEKILHIGGAQSFFPLFYSFDHKPEVEGFYSTLQKTRLLFIPLKDFQNRLETDAMFTKQMLAWYAHEMDHVVLRLKSLERSNAKQKLLQALAYLCEQHAVVRPLRSNWYRVSFPLTQQTIAELTGLTRETVNAAFKEIEGLNLVNIPKKTTLEINKKKLFKLLEEQ
jgi:CRP-like cAMP-binding protein